MKNNILSVLVALVLFAQTSCMTSPDPSRDLISVKDYGAAGDGIADDTAEINAAIAAAKSAGYKTVYFPVGIYKISESLDVLNSSFDMVSLAGENPRKTIIQLSSGSSTDPILKTSGGSGQFNFASIQDLQFVGNHANTAIQIKGTGGVRVLNCFFENLALGIEFTNDTAAGTFTEFSFAQDCHFNSTCVTAVKFKKGAGDRSFHGSGLRACSITRSASNTSPAIQIGEGNDHVFLYNAPMDFIVWTANASDIVSIPSSSSAVYVEGNIKVENLGGDAVGRLVAGPGILYLAGQLLSWGDIKPGSLRQVESIKRNGDGSVNAAERLRRYRYLTRAETTNTEVYAGELGSFVSLVITAKDFDYRELIFISHDGYGANGSWEQIALTKTGPGEGLRPAYTVDSNGRLVIFNASYDTTEMDIKIARFSVGGRKDFFWSE